MIVWAGIRKADSRITYSIGKTFVTETEEGGDSRRVVLERNRAYCNLLTRAWHSSDAVSLVV
ncbi:hypothetical protein J437_LFUL005624, partial [Ladona fulva]